MKIFISDVHLGDGSPTDDFSRDKEFLEFLEFVCDQAKELVIVGDLFELWQAALDRVLFQHSEVVNKLLSLKEKIKVTYVIGNHDYIPFVKFVDSGVGICLEYHDCENSIVAEHGYRYDIFNRYKNPLKSIKWPMGKYFSLFIANLERLIHPDVDEWAKEGLIKIDKFLHEAMLIRNKVPPATKVYLKKGGHFGEFEQAVKNHMDNGAKIVKSGMEQSGGEMFCSRCGLDQEEDASYCTNCGAPMAREKIDSVEGTIQRATREGLLAGRYRIIEELGRGGMGVVLLAEDAELRIVVALKVLPNLIATDRRSIEAMRDEARIAIGLTHTNIMSLNAFESRDECKFLVMEYIRGPNLDDVIANQGRLSPDVVVEVVSQACKGLSYAHAQKVIHRDVKPSNLMLAFPEETPYNPDFPLEEQPSFTVKVCDFGIARQAKDSLSRVSQIETSGTLLYMSPEHLRGERLDRRADIYSLGATMYEMLSGKPPFTTGSIHYQVLSKEPDPIEGIPDGMNAIVIKCLAKGPDERFASCEELAEVLGRKEIKGKRTQGRNEVHTSSLRTFSDDEIHRHGEVKKNKADKNGKSAPLNSDTIDDAHVKSPRSEF